MPTQPPLLQRRHRHGVKPVHRLRPWPDEVWWPEQAGAHAPLPWPEALAPVATGAPTIGISTDRRDRGPSGGPEGVLTWPYAQAVLQAGGRPVLIPPGTSVDRALQGLHGLVLTGGAFDIHPRHYGAQAEGRLDRIEDARTDTELGLARAVLAMDLPVLGICGGLQALAVAAGGSLIQDLPAHPIHEQPTDPRTGWHAVEVSEPLATWIGTQVLANSTHHQAVDRVPAGWVISATTHDGVVEGLSLPSHRYAHGVQWHPELLGDLRVYEGLIAASTAVRDGLGRVG